MVEAHPSVVRYKLGLSDIYFQLGYLRTAGSAISTWRCRGIRRRCPFRRPAHLANPDHTDTTDNLAWTCNNLGYLQHIRGRSNEVLRSYGLAVQYRRQLVDSVLPHSCGDANWRGATSSSAW